MTQNVPALVIVIPKDATPVIYEMLWPVSPSHGPFPIVCGPLPVPNWPPPFEALPRCECGGFHHHPNCTHVSRTMPPVEESKLCEADDAQSGDRICEFVLVGGMRPLFCSARFGHSGLCRLRGDMMREIEWERKQNTESKPRQYVPDYPPKKSCPWPHEEKWEDVCRRLRDDVLEEIASNLSRVTLVGDISGAVRKMKSEGK